MKKRAIVVCVAAVAAFTVLAAEKRAPAESDAVVKDISGRSYYSAVRDELRKARKSIVMAMYQIAINPGKTKNPAYMLTEELVAARKRGVDVTVYLDRSTWHDGESERSETNDTNEAAYELLKQGGVDARYVEKPRLHAKLIVIDGKVVIDGSCNWSYSALRSNVESSSLIVSATHAGSKLAWLESMLASARPAPRRSKISAGRDADASADDDE